jgi:hypothetical protein
MLRHLFTLSSALLLSVAVAAPAPVLQSASSLAQVTSVLGVAEPAFASGFCHFEAKVTRQCKNNQVVTTVGASSFSDNKGASILNPEDDQPLALKDSESRIEMKNGELEVTFIKEGSTCKFWLRNWLSFLSYSNMIRQYRHLIQF